VEKKEKGVGSLKSSIQKGSKRWSTGGRAPTTTTGGTTLGQFEGKNLLPLVPHGVWFCVGKRKGCCLTEKKGEKGFYFLEGGSNGRRGLKGKRGGAPFRTRGGGGKKKKKGGPYDLARQERNFPRFLRGCRGGKQGGKVIKGENPFSDQIKTERRKGGEERGPVRGKKGRKGESPLTVSGNKKLSGKRENESISQKKRGKERELPHLGKKRCIKKEVLQEKWKGEKKKNLVGLAGAQGRKSPPQPKTRAPSTPAPPGGPKARPLARDLSAKEPVNPGPGGKRPGGRKARTRKVFRGRGNSPFLGAPGRKACCRARGGGKKKKPREVEKGGQPGHVGRPLRNKGEGRWGKKARPSWGGGGGFRKD